METNNLLFFLQIICLSKYNTELQCKLRLFVCLFVCVFFVVVVVVLFFCFFGGVGGGGWELVTLVFLCFCFFFFFWFVFVLLCFCFGGEGEGYVCVCFRSVLLFHPKQLTKTEAIEKQSST